MFKNSTYRQINMVYIQIFFVPASAPRTLIAQGRDLAHLSKGIDKRKIGVMVIFSSFHTKC